MRIEQNPRMLEQLKRHEGLRLEPYRDTVGVLTVGYGHNLEAWPVPGVGDGGRITQEQADALLAEDVARAAAGLDRALPWWRELGEERQAVLLNMCFNLGLPKLCGFSKMLAAAEKGQWVRATREMGDSLWARQVKGRALELMNQMLDGVWQA